MSQPFIGEIRLFAGTYAPLGWAFCDGSLLPIGEYETLYYLIGTTYGGDGQSTFALPDLRGRVPFHAGPSFPLGYATGSEQVTLAQLNLPAHTHALQATSSDGDSAVPTGRVWAASDAQPYYAGGSDDTMAAEALAPAGEGQPHPNLSPFACVNFIIALQGIYPLQN